MDSAETERAGEGIAVGSRAHLQDEAVAQVCVLSWGVLCTPGVLSHVPALQRSALRTVLMHGFHGLVVVLGGVRGIRDTQCGFKLFTRSSARRVFHSLHLERWCFDVELLYIAQSMSIPVCEVR